MSIFPRENAQKRRLLAFFVEFPISSAHPKKRKSNPKGNPKLSKKVTLNSNPKGNPNQKISTKKGIPVLSTTPGKITSDIRSNDVTLSP